jgi:hypothetical protein
MLKRVTAKLAPNFKVEGAIPPRGGIAYTVETIAEYLNWKPRYAPNFQVLKFLPHGGNFPYTVETITEYLNWKPKKVEAALAALTLIEQQPAEGSKKESSRGKILIRGFKKPESIPTLAEAGIDKNLANRARTMAAIT